jgi:hypothetical protein
MPLRRALEVWLPTQAADPFEAPVLQDVFRGFLAYRGDIAVRFEARRRRESRRGVFPFATLYVPAARDLEVEVFHVGTNGYVWGSPRRYRELFPDKHVNNFLDSWLQLDPRSLLSAVSDGRAPEPFTRFPLGSTGSLHHVHGHMLNVAKGANDPLPIALHEAMALMLPYVTEAYSFWFPA